MSSDKALDPNEELEGTSDMGGFSLPPVGDIGKGTGVLMEFTGEIDVCGDDDDGLLFELSWAEDASAKAKIYVNKNKQAGLSRMIGIGEQSGVFIKINKKRKAKGKTSITSDTGKVKVKILQDSKFHDQLRKEIVGCQVTCTITHSPAKPYEDKDGVMKDGFPQANIGKIIAPSKAKKAVTEKAETSGDPVEEDEEWEED